MKHKVVLADDHQFLMEGIMIVLKEMDSLEVVATTNNGHELLEIISKQNVSLVIMDLNMPGYDGLQCLQRIKTNNSKIKVLILTNYNQPELVDEVKRMMADGFLVKNSSASELKIAVEEVLSGRPYFPSNKDLKQLANESHFFDNFLKKYQLTKREVEIIKMVCAEMTTKEIAASLFLSELTINTHRRNILRKLEVKNVAALINFAKLHQLF